MSESAQVHVVVAPVFGTNCCIVAAPGAGAGPRDCVIIDAGAGVSDGVARVVEEQGLRPRAVLATHGHADHTWDAAGLCDRYDIPLRLHAADAYRLADPFGTLSGDGGEAIVSGALGQELAGLGFSPETYRVPARIEGIEMPDGAADLAFGALTLRAVHAPGHTEGSTLYLLDEPFGIAFTGDVLFAGSIGRTDLPGGDGATMRSTVHDVVGRLAPSLTVVPGHGPTTTVQRELATNPFL
ncbi:MBL fold metallo-hydrolase [Myceligenerans crystallogenes]|uniref:MBL fold metallo-hydrolase n=1 Tax=Myceligenerans crystallogenes TaxID=316335 RepID=A0ABN2N8I4_9MICO